MLLHFVWEERERENKTEVFLILYNLRVMWSHKCDNETSFALYTIWTANIPHRIKYEQYATLRLQMIPIV